MDCLWATAVSGRDGGAPVKRQAAMVWRGWVIRSDSDRGAGSSMGIMRSRDVCTSLGGRGADSRRGFNTAGKNMQLKTRYDGKLPVALSDWRFVCEHRS